MPRYRIISELDTSAEHRDPREACLHRDGARLVTVVESEDLFWATKSAYSSLRSGHLDRRIVSVEEVHPGFTFSDEEITRALTGPALVDDAGDPLMNPGEFEDITVPLAKPDTFASVVEQVGHGLRESGLVPGLDISVLIAHSLEDPYAVIEVYDDARSVYFSRGTEVQELTDDHSAIGWDGVLAVARELVSFSNDLH
ncbi:hypothetical protein ACFRQM_32985 [Streptomyces sp. NPDC056831]|uniref:hypothetical protein n=1 Tax=Streptomyces sp. NPDC056831 TaxID=3345954 RepID=UPI0036B5EC58